MFFSFVFLLLLLLVLFSFKKYIYIAFYLFIYTFSILGLGKGVNPVLFLWFFTNMETLRTFYVRRFLLSLYHVKRLYADHILFQVLTLLHYVWSSHSREVPKEILICLVWWLRKVLRKIISRESLEKLVGKIVKS